MLDRQARLVGSIDIRFDAGIVHVTTMVDPRVQRH